MVPLHCVIYIYFVMINWNKTVAYCLFKLLVKVNCTTHKMRLGWNLACGWSVWSRCSWGRATLRCQVLLGTRTYRLKYIFTTVHTHMIIQKLQYIKLNTKNITSHILTKCTEVNINHSWTSLKVSIQPVHQAKLVGVPYDMVLSK